MEAEAAYLQAMRIENGEISEAEARRILVSEYGVNNASASDMVRNFGQMLKGKVYHRTLSLLVTELYFDRILDEFGTNGLRNALAATRAHISYYKALPTGGRLPSLTRLCDDYADKLTAHKSGELSPTTDKLQANFQARISQAQQDSSEERQKRLKKAGGKTQKVWVRTAIYKRNADVVAERLFQANGVCDQCYEPAPFNRKDGSPYLEVHHRTPLSEGGEDTIGNTMALCANCHREAHFGEFADRFRSAVAE
ncbi:HNH endonuclease [Ruegeria atlantica]|uniref:HNH endonuclease n=1 Tax=Ruegeria atlantica TaxID=81569 RepID=UPI001C2BED82|nr:HNH endonuclease signature motif containing protein [Ruegeria atlantica]